MVGARQTTDLLEKITWGLLSAMFILTLSSNFFVPRSTMDDFLKDANIDKASEKRTAPATTPKPIEQKNADEKKTDEKKTEAKPAEKK
jgi:preprotein translocase subunit SecG